MEIETPPCDLCNRPTKHLETTIYVGVASLAEFECPACEVSVAIRL